MSYASKQSGLSPSNEVGKVFLTTSGSTLPVAPATLVSGTTYSIAETSLITKGIWMIEVQAVITGDNTTAFEAIQVSLETSTGVALYDNWLVGATLASVAPIELNGTYPLVVTDTTGEVSVKIVPTFAGTAPTAQGLIRPFKVV